MDRDKQERESRAIEMAQERVSVTERTKKQIASIKQTSKQTNETGRWEMWEREEDRESQTSLGDSIPGALRIAAEV